MLLQNIISHGIARIAEHISSDSPEVIAHGFTSPLLRSMGETEIVDELRVIINDENRTTAYFTFSSQMRPSLHEFRIYGPKNGLVLDQDQRDLDQASRTHVQELRRKVRPSCNHGRTESPEPGDESEDISGKGLPDEVRNEIFDRIVLPLDRGRYTSADPVSRNSFDCKNHGRYL